MRWRCLLLAHLADLYVSANAGFAPRAVIGALGRLHAFLRSIRIEKSRSYWLQQCPTGKSRMRAMRKLPVVPICRNPTALPLPPNQRQISPRPALTRGAYRDRHERWVRDAMDALASQDERRYCGLEKSCGPGAPTLASSLRKVFRRRRWQKSPVTGESTKETVKTIAQGRPGQSGEPVVTTLVCFIYFAREAAGATGTRLSLRPLSFEGHCLAKLGRVAPRECGFVFEIRKPSLRGAKRRSNPFFFAA
jgi:hypothetical protein